MRSRWTLRASVAVAVLAVAMSFAMAGTAFGASYNQTCTNCHSSSGQWAVGDVDRATACSKCHTPGLLGSHPYHNPGANCGAVCHPGWGASMQYATPAWQGPQGTFASAQSSDVPPSVLHVIHSSARWMSSIETQDSKCASCHSIAACSSCHEDAPSESHTGHASVMNPAWSGVTGSGIVGEDQSVSSATTEQNQCATPACHDLAGSQSRTPTAREDNGTGVVKSPALNWTVKYGSNYTAGRTAGSNKAGSTIAFTFTGQQVEILSDRDPYRGHVAISIDGGAETIVDLYAATTSFQQVVYRSATLTDSSHTVTIRVPGTKNPAARAAYVFLDAFRFYGQMPENQTPACISCHATTCSGSGGGFSHEATKTAGTYSGYACNQCHTVKLKDEHLRASSSTSAQNCSACHSVYADYAYDDYDGTCSSTGDAGRPGCHQLTQAAHVDVATDHAATPDVVTSDCIGCHSGDVGVIHDDTNAARPQHASLTGGGSNGLSYSTSCLTCHSATSMPSTKDCDAAGCHVASGVVSMATHPAPDHDAAPALGEALRTGGKACSTCHAVNAGSGLIDAVGDHGKATARTSTNQPIGCMTCHGAAYYPTDWLGQNNTCVSCHPSNGTKAGAPHEAAEYSSKHDYSADGTNAASCGTGPFCHAVAAVDLIHDASNPGDGDCENCHTAAVRQTGVPTVRSCATCHPTGHDYTKHVTTASAACVTCHASTDVRDLHADCATCHANPSYPGLTGLVATADCVNCHAATGALASQNYAPVDPAHATGNEPTHTATPFTAAYQGAGADGTVAALGKECSDCHSSTLKSAHASTSTNGGSVTCTECHLDTTLGAASTVAADWSQKKCTNCHDTGAATTHADFGTIHAVSAGTCAGTGSGCHNYTDLAQLHNKNQAGGAPNRQSCGNTDAGDPTACHATDNVRPVRWASNAASCGEGTSGCHTDKNVSNHGKKHALTIATSVYADGAGEGVAAGCLSSGAGGCHDSLGAGNTSTDIAAYHQTTQCETSACHVSADKATHVQPFTCAGCHDGTFSGAVDTLALADPATSGHYPVVNHTATGGLGSVSVGGSASESCTVCHDTSLLAAHTGIASTTKGANVTCAECHGYNINVVSQVKTSNWTTDSCSDCHSAGVMPGAVMHSSTVAFSVAATGSAGCASSGRNCHVGTDLHEMHKDAAGGCDLAGCHDATNKNKVPTAKSCGASGACHTTGFNTNTSFPTHTPSEEGAHAPTTNTQEGASWSVASQSVACGACHLVSAADGGLLSEHALATSAMTVAPGNACQNCHGNSASDASIGGTWATNRDTANACATCHTAGLAVHANENAAAHTDVTSASCGNTGAGCHPTNNLASVGTPSTTANIHTTCLRCHDHTGSTAVPAPGGGNMKWDPAKDTCGNGRECHNIAGQYPTSGDPLHRSGLPDVANGDDTTHHTGVTANKTNYPETAAGVYSDNLVCAGCHSNTLKTAHSVTSTNGGSVTCLECHNGSGAITGATAAGQVKGDWSTDKCTDCHTPASSHTSFKTGASTYSANHTATMNAGCAGSGTGCHGTRPDSLTSVAPAGEMVQLHTTPGCSASSGTAGTSCHALNKPMAATGKTCGSGSNCHNTYTTTAGHAGNTVTGNDTLHTVTVASMDTITDATYTYGVQCNNCHSSGLTTAHTGVTAAMESGASWAAGATPFCTNCHNTTTPDNAASVIKTTTWNKTCDACHVTSGNGKHTEYGTKHTATTSGCTLASGCHGFSGSQTIDIRAMHDKSTAGCSASGTDGLGWNGGCHSLDKSMVGTTMTCGDTGACHNNHLAGNHAPEHDISDVVPTANLISATAYVYHGTSYTAGNSWGCGGCHFTDLIKEHGTAASGGAGRTMDDGPTIGSGCGVCHTDQGGTVGSPANRSAILGAITRGNTSTGDMRCVTCHNGLATGTTKPHMGTATTTNSTVKTSGNPLAEFVDDGYKSGGHNIGGTAYAKLNPDNNGATAAGGVSWTYKGTFVGTNPRTGTTWTRTDQLLCSDCHVYSANAAAGPQGAAAAYNIKTATGYTTSKLYMTGASPYITVDGTAPGMCGLCHGALSATPHTNNSNHKQACVFCHRAIPHSSPRPRLLVGSADTAPYKASITQGMDIKNTTDGTVKTSCSNTTSGCSSHGAAGPYW